MGEGQKVRDVLRNPEKPNFLAGYPEILPGYSGIARKVGEKMFVFNSRPLFKTSNLTLIGAKMEHPKFADPPALKTLTSLNQEVRPFS